MRRRDRWILAIGAAVVAAGALLSIPPSEAPFREHVAQLRARGEPVTVAEYLGPEPDPSDNAAQAVFEAVNWEAGVRSEGFAGPWEENATGSWFETAPAARLRELADRLDNVAPFFDDIAAASRRRHLSASVPFVRAITEFEDPLIRPLQASQRLLSARTFAARTTRQRVEAIETLARLSTLARGTLLRRMVGVAIMHTATLAVRHELTSPDFDAADLRSRLDPLMTATSRPAFADAVRSERAALLELCQSILDGRVELTRADSTGLMPPPDGVQRALKQRVFGLFRNGGTPIASPADWVEGSEFLDELSAIDTPSYSSLQRELRRRIDALPAWATARLMSTPYPRLVPHLAYSDARTRLARIAMAAAEHRATRGDFPASLDELRWAFPEGVPLDPFTDAPFAFARTDTGIRIASLGRLAEEPSLDDATLRDRVLVWELKR